MEYINRNHLNIDCQHINDEKLNQNIINIIENTQTNEFDLVKETKIIQFLKKYISKW